jgi:hypothetical protein
VADTVHVNVEVGLAEALYAGVHVAEYVPVAVTVKVPDLDGVGVAVETGLDVIVFVAVAVGVMLRVCVKPGVFVRVMVPVGCIVRVAVTVGLVVKVPETAVDVGVMVKVE